MFSDWPRVSDAAQTIEDSFNAAVDLKPIRDVTLQTIAAPQNRELRETD